MNVLLSVKYLGSYLFHPILVFEISFAVCVILWIYCTALSSTYIYYETKKINKCPSLFSVQVYDMLLK